MVARRERRRFGLSDGRAEDVQIWRLRARRWPATGYYTILYPKPRQGHTVQPRKSQVVIGVVRAAVRSELDGVVVVGL